MIFKQTSMATFSLSADMQAMVFALVSIPSVIALTAALYAPVSARLLVIRPAEAARAGREWPYRPLPRMPALGT